MATLWSALKMLRSVMQVKEHQQQVSFILNEHSIVVSWLSLPFAKLPRKHIYPFNGALHVLDFTEGK